MDAAAAANRGRLPELAKFELFEELGHGGMATVYRARDKRLGREVAVKVIHPHLRDSGEVVSRFNTEARAVAKLRHPNIVEVFDVSDPDEAEQYLVVELLRGTTLRRLLKERRAIPPEVAAVLASELLGALAHAHANGVVHRDVKPENVLIELRTGESGGVAVKLTDFGIAKLLDTQGVTSTGQVLGSPAHMAPEQIEGAEVDARADVFGLGVLLYECMVGHLPFEGSNPAQVLRRVLEGHYPEAQRERPVVGARFSAIIDRALAHAPDDRYASATEMREAITAELERLQNRAGLPEVEAWLKDPSGYEATHTKRMIDQLCTLGSETRKRGDVLSAAADYNRALAHAPDDARLLRIVVAMNRIEARARLFRRVAMAMVLMLGLGTAAFGLGRYLRARAPSTVTGAPSGAIAITSAPILVVRPATEPSASDSVAAPSVSGSAAPVPLAPSAPRETPPRLGERTVTLELAPTMGVKLSIDGESQQVVSSGQMLRLDTRPHSLALSCDVCAQKVERLVGAGDRDETIAVTVPIKPATLFIQGDLDKTYQILDDPQLPIRAGENVIPLKSQYRSVSVRQVETDVRHRVRLEAGKTMTAQF
jgi:eukaryotic-like serine/threonine-protein kinase